MSSDRFKFRFWHTKEKVMSGIVELMQLSNFDSLSGNYDDELLVPMQSTGLKDKNGVLIFEGDILEFVTRNIAGRSDTRRVGVMFNTSDASFDVMVDRMPFCLNEIVSEIIGNVYQNPELIEGEL